MIGNQILQVRLASKVASTIGKLLLVSPAGKSKIGKQQLRRQGEFSPSSSLRLSVPGCSVSFMYLVIFHTLQKSLEQDNQLIWVLLQNIDIYKTLTLVKHRT